MDKSIVENARRLVSDENRRFEEVIQQLERQRQELVRKNEEAQASAEISEKKRQKAEKEAQELKRKAENELKRAREEAVRIISSTRAEAENLLEEMNDMYKSRQLTAEEKAKLRADIRSMENKADPVERKKDENYKLPRNLKKGDSVLIADIDKKAVVIEEPKNGEALVQAGVIKTRVSIKNLRLIEENAGSKNKPQKGSLKRNVKSNADVKAVTDIDLRGLTAQEAVMELDMALDSAVLSGIHQVTIIHGKGTGVLRTEVHKYLKRCKYVKTYRLGVFGEGESGVTIAELK